MSSQGAVAAAPRPISEDARAGPPLVRLSGVDKVFSNGTLALSGLDLSIGRHEFVSLLGPSGCGKSTALRIIAGLGEKTRGRIEWSAGGKGPGGRPDGRIGFVFQEPTLMPWATVFDNVYLPLRLQWVSRKSAAERVRDAIARVGLTGFEEVYPRALSGGMRMRVSIARALVTDPEVLLMDEPFAALDEITRQKLNNDLLELWEGQRWTVIFVTHSVYESVYLSGRIVVMAPRPGRIIADIAIPEAHPRGEAFRTSLSYNEYCRTVSAALREGMRGPGEGAVEGIH